MADDYKVTTYDPGSITINVGGHIVSGFADGTFVSVERDMENYSKMVGAGGSVARARTRNLSGKITLTLMQTSESNSFLESKMAADDLANEGSFAVTVMDDKYAGICEADSAWILKPPTLSYGRDLEDREWVIDCARIVFANSFGHASNPDGDA